MTRKIHIGLLLILAVLLTVAGCEFALNPLNLTVPFDIPIRIEENSGTTFYAGGEPYNLTEIYDEFGDEFDSVKLFNVTILIDNVDATTDLTTTISGSASVDGQEIFRLTDVPLSAFVTEKSIFGSSVQGMQLRQGGVRRLVQQLRHQGSLDRNVTLAAGGTASATPLVFTLHVKIYAQFYTQP